MYTLSEPSQHPRQVCIHGPQMAMNGALRTRPSQRLYGTLAKAASFPANCLEPIALTRQVGLVNYFASQPSRRFSKPPLQPLCLSWTSDFDVVAKNRFVEDRNLLNHSMLPKFDALSQLSAVSLRITPHNKIFFTRNAGALTSFHPFQNSLEQLARFLIFDSL